MNSDQSPTVKLERIYYTDSHFVTESYGFVKMANCNYSLRSVDQVGDIFQNMFPDSLSRTCETYKISERLAACFKKTIVENLVK